MVPLDETVSWVEQNRRAVAVAVGATPIERVPARSPDRDDREFAARLFADARPRGAARPLVGLHPERRAAGEAVAGRALGGGGARLQREFGATILITGSEADRPLAAALARGLAARPPST